MKTVINNTSISGENSGNHLQSRVRRAAERGHVIHGWLDSYFSFSFADYFDPAHIQFGALRVINDDVIAPNSGFGMHPHRDMEILTLPLSGHIEHEDSMGNISRIGPGQIQVMSAGTGIFHSERNPSQTEPVKLLQIWVFPNKKGVTPRYEEMNYVFPEKNSLISLVAPQGYKEEVALDRSGNVSQPLWLHQNVWFYLGDFEAGTSTNYRIRSEQNGLYLFVIEGSVSVNSLELHARDALQLSLGDASLALSSQEMGEIAFKGGRMLDFYGLMYHMEENSIYENGPEVRIIQKLRMPVLFLAHGSPMLALARPEEDPYVAMLQRLSLRIPQPRAILNIGAHFYGPGKWLDVSPYPRTLYDFSGFPKELTQITYPAPGFMEGIQLIQDIFPDKRYQVIQRGLDHGTWTVLRHVFPLANIPVFALSLDSRDSYQDAMELGRRLQELRIKGVLIVANGNIVHNLSDITWSGPKNFAHEYAKAFDTAFMDAWNSQDVEKLCSPHSLVGGIRSVPTPEHYVPALVAYGAVFPNEITNVLFDGFELGSIGRRSLGVGM